MSNKNFNNNPKVFFLILSFFLLVIIYMNLSSAIDTCSVEARQDCVESNIPGAKIVMGMNSITNAHGELAGGNYGQVLCCNFGVGDTACGVNNKLIGLSSATNAHAEVPDLVSPAYNIYNVCYDSLKSCRSVNDGSSPAQGETELESKLYSDTNAHLAKTGYATRVFCFVNKPIFCTLTSASWQSTETLNGTSTIMIVGGTNCGGETISFEVKRGSSSCGSGSLSDCIPPPNVPFGQNGIWTAGPASDINYSFTATVVGTSTQIESPANLHVLASCPYEPPPVLCSGYTNANDCNSNICQSVVFDPEDINPRCEWLDNECKLVSDPPQEVSIVLNPQNPAIDIGLVKSFTVDVYFDGVLTSTGREPTSCTSSNSAVANLTVGSVCSFKGISAGTATITATYDNGAGTTVQNTTTLRVNIGPPVESDIKLIPSDSRILVSATENYNAVLVWSNLTEVSVTSQVTFSSSNTTAATISGNVATGASEGITTISGTRASGTVHEASPAILTVYTDPPPYTLTSIEIIPSGGNVQLGKTFSATGGFGVYASYTDSSENNWVTVGNTAGVSDCVSSDPSIASREGITGCKFKGNAVGTVTITAVYTETGITKQDTATLNVVTEGNVASHIIIVPAERRISVGSTVSYTSWLYWSDSEAQPTDVTSQTTFSSSRTAVATVSGNVATGKSRGSSEIRATYSTYNGLALLHVGPIQPPIAPPGICIWEQIVEGSCADGDEFITVRTRPGPGSSPLCMEKPSRAVVCPAQIPLPFFNIYNVLVALALIGVIYWVIEARKIGKRK